MSEKKLICDLCGKKVYRRYTNPDGAKICESCNESLQNGMTLDIETPEVKIWVGEVSKMGEKLYFNIPKEQRPYFKHKERYSIVARRLK